MSRRDAASPFAWRRPCGANGANAQRRPGVTKPVIRRLARLGGIRRISDLSNTNVLSCDACGAVFHSERLRAAPQGEWLCPSCEARTLPVCVVAFA